MDLMDLYVKRRSIRTYTQEAIGKETLEKIVQAGLLAPTGQNKKPCSFCVVQDKELLKALSVAKAKGAAMIENAQAVIAVFGDTDKTDTWVEDSSIALTYMDLMAASLGLGTCWVQYHFRAAEDGTDAMERAREILGYPQNQSIVGVLVLGMPQGEAKPHALAELDWGKVKWL